MEQIHKGAVKKYDMYDRMKNIDMTRRRTRSGLKVGVRYWETCLHSDASTALAWLISKKSSLDVAGASPTAANLCTEQILNCVLLRHTLPHFPSHT
jgi:hypothetical protein